ncbi:hypothetical protein PIN31115_01918 [Pandoraea iniqua]|uniref:Uncharacterized protein n=1 Tax=Pandoraea iniqua TaxID=2508288 RepID=A0A5E4UCT6_9BURK|nr:hypothetical protein [Pandoraea iniqua]VVD97352.1 hypothetical protein PIN31115_01918 [Pandoraea iniqua]
MAPIFESLGAAAQGLATDAVQTFIKKKVIERWTQKRAACFYEAFLDEVRKQADTRFQSATLDELLASLGDQDDVTSSVFEAYRRVCLSASKDIGPRIIGLLTAKIALANRQATEQEELVFQAAEALTDSDLKAIVDYAQWAHSKLTDAKLSLFKEHGFTSYLLEEFDTEEIQVGGHFGSLPIFNISENVGVWAMRLQTLCLIAEDRRETIRQVLADSELHRDEDGYIRRVSDYIRTTPAFHGLVSLAERAIASV